MLRIKVILADRAEIIRSGLERILQAYPHIDIVSLCSTGSEVIEATLRYRPDIIIMGSTLRNCSSIELLEFITKELPKVKVIMLTEEIARVNLGTAIMLGIKGYIDGDSITSQNIIGVIDTIAKGEIVISSILAASMPEEFKFFKPPNERGSKAIVNGLTRTERVIMNLVEQGLTNSEIATLLSISGYTVKVHMRNIMGKLRVNNRQKAVLVARGNGLTTSLASQGISIKFKRFPFDICV